MASTYNGTHVEPAYYRLDQEYNFAGYPSVFFDGGDEVYVGGDASWGPFTGRILTCGSRVVIPINFIVATRHLGGNDYEVRVRAGNGVPANNPPPDPDIPTGPAAGYPDSSLQFESAVVDPDADDGMYYDWDWGDGQTSGWVGPYDVGIPCQISHVWTQKGTYDVKVRCKDSFEETTNWSPLKSVYIRCCVVAGDVDNSGTVNVADLTFLVDYLFNQGLPPECIEQSDTDGSTETNVADVTYLVDYLFGSGPAPTPCP